jgi:hypothetical protein
MFKMTTLINDMIRQSQQRQKEQKQLLDLMIQFKRNQPRQQQRVFNNVHDLMIALDYQTLYPTPTIPYETSHAWPNVLNNNIMIHDELNERYYNGDDDGNNGPIMSMLTIGSIKP